MNSAKFWNFSVLVLMLLLYSHPVVGIGWDLPTLELEAKGVTKTGTGSVDFSANFVLSTSVNVTADGERMRFRSELAVPDLLQTIFDVPSEREDESCLSTRLPPPNVPDRLVICDVRIIDFDKASSLGEFNIRGVAQVAQLKERQVTKSVEFGIRVNFNQEGRDLVVDMKLTVPSTDESGVEARFPNSVEIRYQLEPCFERHEVKVESVDYLRSARLFAIKSHAATLWAQGALGCRARYASR